jgi:RNA polymerase sigma-70 factor (ECF subfamily)
MGVERRLRFELLYGKYGPVVKAYALRRVHESAADDLVAEVFMVCWRRFDELPLDPLPWLLGVARRVASTQRRGERRRAALGERLIEAALDPPETVPALTDSLLAQALERLRDSDRELLLLIAWDGLSPAQAAVVLGIKPATARVRLLRARRRLVRSLADGDSTAPTCVPLSMESSS